MEARLKTQELQEISKPSSRRYFDFPSGGWDTISSETGMTLENLDQWVEGKVEEKRQSCSRDTIHTYVVEFRGTSAGLLPYEQKPREEVLSEEEGKVSIALLRPLIAAIAMIAVCLFAWVLLGSI
ncbi:hypothetical protein LTR37_019672 [Vermiconidia calcicola]|uniref:Uncharacterized protein n=1 Tax=Vermiconidia calcicola TaxID=1690605 RepID=A0ACC3MDQ6_9PEZI|nr:hypothetical protein LTR37_019672 [Vermiconidia calcicola]